MIDSAVLDMPVAEVEFSNRTRNVIMRHFPPSVSPTLRDLAELSQGTLLGSPGCGQKSVTEIETRLSALGLALGMTYAETKKADPDDIEKGSLRPVFRPELFTKLSDIEWSVRTRNCLMQFYPDLKVSTETGTGTRAAILGDLIVLSRAQLLQTPNMGRTSLAQIERTLSDRDLNLGMNVPGWNEEAVETYLQENIRYLKKDRKAAATSKYKAFLPEGHIYLEDEILALLSFAGITVERNVDMFLRNTGLDGKGGATLEAIGRGYSVTRERVRQIVARDKRKFRDGLLFKLDVYEQIISHLDTVTCASTESVETALVSKGLTRKPFDLRGLFELEDIINPKSIRFSDYEIDKLPGTDTWYLFRGNMRRQLKTIRSEIKRQSSNQGYAKISDLLAFCVQTGVQLSQEQLMSVLKETGDLRFLNSEEDAFVIIGVRNRLFNGISKCLIAHRPLKAARIKDGLRRYARLTRIPTISELLEFCRVHPDLKIDGSLIDWTQGFNSENLMSDTESQFINAFDSHDEILTFKELQNRCLRAGVNPVTVYLYAARLPCLESDGYGRFALRGCPGDPFNLDRSSSGFSGENSIQSLQNVKDGKTTEGHYWLAFELDDKIAKSGAFIPSQQLKELLSQPLNIESAKGEFYGRTALIGQGVSGFKQAFLANGAEEGDMIIIVHNADLKKIILALGSDDQLETAKNAKNTDSQVDSEMVEL